MVGFLTAPGSQREWSGYGGGGGAHRQGQYQLEMGTACTLREQWLRALEEESWAHCVVPKAKRDRDWIRKRRQWQARLREAWQEHADCVRVSDEQLAETWRRTSAAWSQEVQEVVRPNATIQESLQAVAEEDDRMKDDARRRRFEGHDCGGERYRAFFCEDDRALSQGPAGTRAKQPKMPPGSDLWAPRQWADWWLQLGGFHEADMVDKDGWTPLHHACHSVTFFSNGYLVCEGLIGMMSLEWLGAKTKGGRPKGWTAMHFLANGSDVEMRKAHLCVYLGNTGVDIDATDEAGRTPFLICCGSGAVDVAKALSQALGCKTDAVSDDGRNAADRAMGSSGKMLGCPGLQPALCQPGDWDSRGTAILSRASGKFQTSFPELAAISSHPFQS